MVVLRKMKEKCKDAARMRREKERVEFVELSKLLPLPSSTTSQLDKASIIRLTSSYLRMRSAFPQGLGENWGTKQKVTPFNESIKSSEVGCAELSTGETSAFPANFGNSSQLWNPIRELGSLLLQTLDGFVFALHRDGKIMYISETASVHLGLPQIDLTGSSIFDYIHPADHNDIMDILNLSESERAKVAGQFGSSRNRDKTMQGDDTIELSRSFCMRMKCVLPKRNAGLISNGYKAIHCSGYLKAGFRESSSTYQKLPKLGSSETHLADQKVWDSYALVAVGHSLLSTASTEIKLDTKTFMFRTNLDLRIHFIETLATNLLGYQQSEIIGQSLYQFVHIADLHHLESAHKQVLEKGQVVSKYHRLMRHGGGYVWVQTYATIINNPRSMPKPQHIVGICRVIGQCQSDDSRLFLIGDSTRDIESTSLTGVNKPVQQPTVLISTLDPQSWISGKPTTSGKPAARLVSKCNRNQRRVASRQQHSSRTSRSYDFKKLGASKTSLDTRDGSLLPSALRTIGPIRRKSDDSCSVVSSLGYSTSSQSASCHGYNGPTQTTDSPSYHAIGLDQAHPYKVATSYLHDHGTPIEPVPASNHTNQYSSSLAQDHTNKCGLQDYWSRCGMQVDKTTFPISIDTSINQYSGSSTATIATTISPTLTTSTTASGQGSANGSPVGECTLTPERAYASEQYYYRLHGPVVPCDSYQNDDYNVTYSNGTQVYMDYTRSEGSLVSMPYDDRCTPSFYYASHQEKPYLTGNGFA